MKITWNLCFDKLKFKFGQRYKCFTVAYYCKIPVEANYIKDLSES